MRLTLRTLLAYLDDTLEPAQAKLIGQKIAESETAQELVARIKEVVRRRRLTTPPTNGPGAKLDANTVAEYIDNVLPGEQLAAVEEVCLESDVYLAEIAACHQILSVIISEPLPVPPMARQRMYGLFKAREAIPSRKATPARPTEAAGNRMAKEHDEADETLLLGLPLYAGRGGWGRVAAIGVILLLVGGLAAAIWQLLPDSTRETIPIRRVAQANTSGKEIPVPIQGHEGDPSTDNPKTDKEGHKGPEKIKEEKASPEHKNSVPDVKENSNSKVPSTPPVNPPVAATPDVPAPRNERRVVGKYLSAPIPNVLLQHISDKPQWQRVQRESSVYTGDQLLSLPGYRSEIRLENGLHLLLWGNVPVFFNVPVLESRIVMHVPEQGFDADFTIETGRVVISNHKTEGSAKVRARFQDQVWELTLLDNDSALALELWGLPDFGYSKDPGRVHEPASAMYLIDLKGQANIKAGYETHLVREPPGPALFIWNNSRRGQNGWPETMKQPPAWANKIPPRTKPAQAMVKALDTLSDRLSGKAAIDVVLTEQLKESEPLNRLAVYSLGATDDLASLLDALGDEQQRDIRLGAIETLAHWLGRKADHDILLYKVLETKFKAGPAEIIMTLLHGFSIEQQSQPETYETLFEYLKNDKLPVRELAYWRLSTMAPTAELAKKTPYDPAGGSDQRSRAYEEWKKAIPDGQLPPKLRPSSPPTGKKSVAP